MFREFGPAPLCLDLDFDTFEGPPHFVRRFRDQSGWLLVAEATIQSRYELLREKIVVACDEHGQAIPSFQARHLTECNWSRPTECVDDPPDLLDELLCEEEGALIVRWHRQRNTALAESHERQLARIEAIEGKARAFIRRNEHRIADLRRRRRHPLAGEAERALLTVAIGDLEAESELMLAEMAATRAAVRRRSEQEEERLWSRADLLVEVETLHLVKWKARRVISSGRGHSPACWTGRSTNLSVSVDGAFGWILRSAIARAARCSEPNGSAPPTPIPEATVEIVPDNRPQAAADDELLPADPIVGINASWTPQRVAMLRQLWLEGVPAKDIAHRLGGMTHNRVIGKAYRIGLPKRETAAAAELRAMANTKTHEPQLAQKTERESPWTSDKVELLQSLWLRGVSAGTIAKLIGGTSRNAVIGKAKRLGLPMREHPLTRAAGSDHQGIA